MSYYTVTNPDNSIAFTFETVREDLALIQKSETQTLHAGQYSPLEYTYDGENFIEIANVEKSIFIKSHTELLFTLIKQLRKSGVMLPLHIDFIDSKLDAKSLIDQAASAACERFVSPGKFTIVEYQFTQQSVNQWRANNSPTDNVPEMLASWFDNSDFATVELAAQNIEQTATQFTGVISLTRRLRLSGKAAVDNASQEDYKAVTQTVINQLEAI